MYVAQHILMSRVMFLKQDLKTPTVRYIKTAAAHVLANNLRTG